MEGKGIATMASMVALCAAIAGGCDCETHRKEMERVADKGFEDALQCCKSIGATNPPGGEACLQSLSAWRQQIAGMIILWYQACLDGNHDLAQQIFQTLRGVFLVQFNEGCPAVGVDPSGRTRTAGLPFDRHDVIELGGAFGGGSGADHSGAPLVLAGGTFRGSIFGTGVNGGLSGSLTLGAECAEGSFAVDDFSLTFATAAGPLRCTLHDPERRSVLAANPAASGAVATLNVHVALSFDTIPLLMPDEAWVEIPLQRTANGYALISGQRSLRALIPPALGFADWIQDGRVGIDDWAAYFAADESERDLDLDGDTDERDDAMFVRSWRIAVGE